jgi:hypothetical protein
VFTSHDGDPGLSLVGVSLKPVGAVSHAPPSASMTGLANPGDPNRRTSRIDPADRSGAYGGASIARAHGSQRGRTELFMKSFISKNAFSKNAFFENFANFWRARSRLYQNEILQENMRSTAFFKLYKICILLHRCNLKIFAKNRFEKTAIFVKFQQNIANVAKFANFCHISKISA